MTLEAAKPKHRYVALDSLRGVCACMVVLVHFVSRGHVAQLDFVKNGFLFVDFFFVLSGFVIGSSYGRRLSEGFSIGQFMWLRLGRVYPLHLFVLLVFLLFEVGFLLAAGASTSRTPFTGSYSPGAFVASLFVVQIFVGPETVWNTPAWSIAAEIWTYLTFALLLRFAGRWLLPLCGVIVLAALLIIPTLTDHYLAVFHEGAFLRCLYGFALGILGWRIMPFVHRINLGGRAVDNVLEIVVVLFVIAFVAMAGAGPWSMVAPFVFFLAVLTFAREGGVVSQLLRTTPLVLIGTLSYSIYMIHWFLLWRFMNGLSLLGKLSGGRLSFIQYGAEGNNMIDAGPWGSDVLMLLFLGIVIVCAYGTWRFVELPGQAFARRQLKKRDPATPLPVAPGAP